MPLKLAAFCLLITCALVPAPAAAQPLVPLLELEGGTVDLGWILSGEGRVRGTATLRGPTLRVSAGRAAPKGSAKAPKPAKKSIGYPLDVDRLVVHQGTIVFVAPGSPGRELLRVHGLELSVEGYSNRRSATAPTIINAKGRIGKSGQLRLSIKAEPGTAIPTFSGNAEISGLGLEELGVLVDKRLAMQPITGKVSLALDFSVRDGRITGVAKPALTGVGVGGLGGGGSSMLGQLNFPLPPEVSDVFKQQTKGRELSAVIPINAPLSPGEPELWTAILDALKTSVLQASTAQFLRLTPTPGVSG